MATRPTFGIVAKIRQPEALELALELLTWLREKKLAYLVETETASSLTSEKFSEKQVILREEIAKRADVVVVLGGDGTLISVAHFPSEKPPLLIGVNLGTLGFLTEIAKEEMISAVESVLNGTARTGHRNLLMSTVKRKNGSESRLFALNDIVITKEALARIFGVDVHVDGELVSTIRGDGVIVSSSAGSTAYSLAAGGSIVHPNIEALLVTPICPHSLTSRPLVLPASSKITLSIGALPIYSREHVFVTVDGQTGVELYPEESVTVESSKYSVEIVKSPSKSFFNMLNSKLKWGTH